ncbi:LSU ribosomal protein L6p (L9e) [hydrothermal vent metagenome]|uniref:LSU ribosomal protein L6p (L9e) n=1 Tax=hydrothermal vent metagenome TaxID=652676 RepID=A0A3B1D2Y4_9ZZZZ
MSRIGKKPIDVPQGVEVKVNGQHVSVKGKLGTLERDCHPSMNIVLEDGKLLVKRPDDARENRALHGLTRALLFNMVLGVSEGFSKTLLIEGVGYRVLVKGKGLEFSLGYSHPIKVEPMEGITFEAPKPTELKVIGMDKALVGQVAANIRALRKPEPYKGKGVRYSDERIRRKAGKTAAAK